MKKYPLALILTDTHLHEGNTSLVSDIWQQAIDKCHELRIQVILFGGDFFTERKAQPLPVDEVGRSIIKNVRENNIRLYGIPGNHDKIDYTSYSSYLDEYIGLDNCTIIRDYQSIIYDDIYIHFIPFFKESSEIYTDLLTKAVKQVKLHEKETHILLTHIAVNGVRNNDGKAVENNLDPNLFKSFKSVLVGHYHNQCKVGDNIYYIGSPYQANYGEDNQKGFTILYSDGSHEFVKSKFKEFIQVKLDVNNEKQIKEAQKEHKGTENNVRFVFQGEEADLKKVSKEKYAEMGIEATFNKDSAVPLNNEDLVKKASSVSFDRHNISEAFEVFCQSKHIEDNSIGKSYLEQI